MKPFPRAVLQVLAFTALLTRFAAGQPIAVVSSTPADGTAGVPPETVVSFTFDRPYSPYEVSINLAELPPGQSLPDPVISADSLTVSYPLPYAPDFDYLWMVHSWYEDPVTCAISFTRAHLLRFTTGSEIGALTLSGTVREMDGAVLGKRVGDLGSAIPLRATLLAPGAEPRTPAVQGAAARRGLPANATAAGGAAEPDYGFVRLNRIRTTTDSQGNVMTWRVPVSHASLDAAGRYEMPYLRPGVYEIEGYRYHPDEGRRIIYDPDGDGVPGTIELSASGPETVDLAAYPFSTFFYPSRAREAEAREAAYVEIERRRGSRPAELRLVQIYSGDVEHDGRAPWTYTYYEPVRGEFVQVDDSDWGNGRAFEAWTGSWSGWRTPGSEPLPDEYLDSGAVMERILADPDVAAFVAAHSAWHITEMTAAAGPTAQDSVVPFGSRPVWHVKLWGYDTEKPADVSCLAWGAMSAGMTLYLDQKTGELLAKAEWPMLGVETAGTYEAVAREGLEALVQDDEIELVRIEGAYLDADTDFADLGTSVFWRFEYRVPSLGCAYVSPGSGGYLEFHPSCTDPGAAAIPVPFVDSDVALETILQAGGTDFLNRFAAAPSIHGEYVGGSSAVLHARDPAYDGRAVWMARFYAHDSAEGHASGDLVIGLDIATGEVIANDLRVFHVAAEPEPGVPAALRLEQNYPNPFNPATTIPFTLRQPALVSVAVYDAAGRHVEMLAEGWHPAGEHTTVWNASGYASGVYLCRIEADGVVLARRMVLLK